MTVYYLIQPSRLYRHIRIHPIHTVDIEASREGPSFDRPAASAKPTRGKPQLRHPESPVSGLHVGGTQPRDLHPMVQSYIYSHVFPDEARVVLSARSVQSNISYLIRIVPLSCCDLSVSAVNPSWLELCPCNNLYPELYSPTFRPDLLLLQTAWKAARSPLTSQVSPWSLLRAFRAAFSGLCLRLDD